MTIIIIAVAVLTAVGAFGFMLTCWGFENTERAWGVHDKRLKDLAADVAKQRPRPRPNVTITQLSPRKWEWTAWNMVAFGANYYATAVDSGSGTAATYQDALDDVIRWDNARRLGLSTTPPEPTPAQETNK